jgi:hypothetical protein
MSNDNHSFKNNEANPEDHQANTPTPEVRPSSSSPKSQKQKNLRSFCQTPNSKRKKLQDSTGPDSIFHSSPHKSRFDHSSIPRIGINIDQCKADINYLEQEHKSLLFAEQKLLKKDWSSAKKQAKQLLEADLLKHEGLMVKDRTELKKMIEIKEKTRKIELQIERKAEFLALVQAKKKLKDEEKKRLAERIEMDKEKSLKARKEMDEKKERLRREKEAKRSSFLESLKANKIIEAQEHFRMNKEKEFEDASEIIGKKKILQENCNGQRKILEHTETLIFN